jgi:flagellum-specific peptidoglycan hydrolase FlgJ
VTQSELNANLKRIAAAAVSLEKEMGIPAELTTGQCIIESGWLAKAPGNNPFGIKAPMSSATYQILETEEELTGTQIRAIANSGKRIVDMGPVQNGRRRVKIQDRFMVFKSLEEAFSYYGKMLIGGTYFSPRWQRYLAHRSIPRLLRDMSGADGQPPYFTSQSYVGLFDQITGQRNVKDALAEARAPKQ